MTNPNDTKLEIVDTHECKSANQHQAIQILNYKKQGWTLFADHSRMIHEGEDEEMEYRLEIQYCPFCGELLSSPKSND